MNLEKKEILQVPSWLHRYVDSDGLRRLEGAVRDAEKQTSAEIVPMIVRESSHTGHVRWVLFLASLALFVGLIPFFYTHELAQQWPLGLIEIFAFCAAYLLAVLLERAERVRRFCVPRSDRVSAANLRAQLEFYESGVTSTQGRTGILIFVSLLERQAVVLADQAIAKRFSAETWDQLVHLLIGQTRQGDFVGGMSAAIHRCGELLSKDFPRSETDRNELQNRLRIEE